MSVKSPGLIKIERFLQLMNDKGASDLHMSVGRPPMIRLHGSLEPIRYRTLTQPDWESMMRAITVDNLWKRFEECGDMDFSYHLQNTARFRVNLFKQERGAGAVFRIIPTDIMTIDQLGLPTQVNRLAKLESGLVLVTGPTGSGKSTTLAAIIDLINATRNIHIITIEDPIEFVHPEKRALIHQREIGAHADSFADALRVAVREDPDLVLVGEMRDLETISIALESAEKGVLVFGTLHTNSAIKTIDRIINVFPAGEHDGVRSVLGETLKAVLAQQLLPRTEGGRVAAIEILFGSPAMANLIREGKTGQINSMIQTGKKEGMIAMDNSIQDLLDDGIITPQAAYDKCIDKDRFKELVEKPPSEV